MNYFKKIIFSLIFLLGITINNSVFAQYIIEQIEQEIPISYELIPENVEFDSFEEEAEFIMNIDSKKLIKAAKENGLEVHEDETTMYLDGNNFAVESTSTESGKVTMISDAKSGKMYTIMWEQKKVLEVSVNDIQEMEDKSKAMVDQMMQNMPEEYRDQVLAEMETTDESLSYIEIVPTGDKKQLFGFKCEGFIGFQEEEAIEIWASNDNIGIVNEIKSIYEKFSKIFNSDDDKDIDEWDLVPGKIPVQVKKISYSGMYNEPIISINTITSIKKQNPPKDTFFVPNEKDGFTRGTMMDMMNELQGFN